MLKTTVAATLAAVLGMGGAAYAADMSGGRSLKDAPAYAPGISWTGFYLGAGGGYGATKTDLDLNGSGSFGTAEGSGNISIDGLGGMGGFGTIQVGYDMQASNRFVIGAFFDYDFAGIDNTISATFGTTSGSIHNNLTDSWTAGGRGGYLVNPATLAYVLGGYTEAHFSLPSIFAHNDFQGWTLGAGFETNLGGPLFLKGEYRYTQLDRQTLLSGDFSASIGGTAFTGTGSLTDQPDVQTGRLLLVYKLGGMGMGPDSAPMAPLK
jgi:outer membrane immunogenic protein